MSETSLTRSHPSGHVFFLLAAALILVCGCGRQVLDEPLTGTFPALDLPAEKQFAVAQEQFRMGDSVHASELLKQTLREAGSYRVMPEALELLGRSYSRMAQPERAAACFELLRYYYPRRWDSLNEVDRNEFTRLIDQASQLDTQAGTLPIPSAHATEIAPAGNPVSNVFYETEIVEVLADLSAQSGVMIIAGEGTRGLISTEFNDLPVAECLRRLCQAQGLSFRWLDGYYLVGKVQAGNALGPFLTRSLEVRPRHIRAMDVIPALPQHYSNHLRVQASDNTVTITGSAELIAGFRRDLAAVDTPPRQVMIEAYIVEAKENLSRELGIEWELVGSRGEGSLHVSQLASGLVDSTASILGQLIHRGLNSGSGVYDIESTVKAMEAAGLVRVKANPRVATLDGQEATIRVASEAYYTLLSGSVSYSYYTLEKISTGTTLKITPYSGESAEIVVDIFVEASDVRGSGANGLPETSVREVKTRSRVDNGETVMIGGLLSEYERRTETKVPFLGSIPLLGALFGRTEVSHQRNELLVFITPYIIIHPQELEAVLN